MRCGSGAFAGSAWPLAAHGSSHGSYVVANELFGQHHSERFVVQCGGCDIVSVEDVCICYGHIKKKAKNVLIVFPIL